MDVEDGHCKRCYTALYRYVKKMGHTILLQNPQHLSSESFCHLLVEVGRRDLAQQCKTELKCEPEAYHHTLPVAARCYACHKFACLQRFRALAQRFCDEMLKARPPVDKVGGYASVRSVVCLPCLHLKFCRQACSPCVRRSSATTRVLCCCAGDVVSISRCSLQVTTRPATTAC